MPWEQLVTMNQRDFEIFHRFLLKHNSNTVSVEYCKLIVATFDAMDELASDANAVHHLADCIETLTFHDFSRELDASIGGSKNPDISHWVGTCYLLALGARLSSSWDSVFDPLCNSLGPKSRLTQSLGDLVDFISTFPVSDGLRHLDHWVPDNTIITDVLAVLYVWISASLGHHGDITLYRKVANMMSLERPFLLVYMAAGCVKRQDILEIFDGEPIATEQYDCMHLLDCFCDLPGPPCL